MCDDSLEKKPLEALQSVISLAKKKKKPRNKALKVYLLVFKTMLQSLYKTLFIKTALPRRSNAFAHTKKRPLLSKVITFLST